MLQETLTSIYNILDDIQLDSGGGVMVKRFDEIFMSPTDNITKYPCLVVLADKLESKYENQQQNLKDFSAFIYVVVNGASNNLNNLFLNILPNAVDSVIKAFDKNYFIDYQDGSRGWVNCSYTGATRSETPTGCEAIGTIELKIKKITNIN